MPLELLYLSYFKSYSNLSVSKFRHADGTGNQGYVFGVPFFNVMLSLICVQSQHFKDLC